MHMDQGNRLTPVFADVIFHFAKSNNNSLNRIKVIMADIIPLKAKLQHTKEKEAEIIRKRKILAVQKIFQCTHCSFKCEKCGTQISAEDKRNTNNMYEPKTPYRFCESCSEEYADYIKSLQGKDDPKYYWYNDEWLELWRKWIDYQGVMDRYLKSKEFKQLLQELKEARFET